MRPLPSSPQLIPVIAVSIINDLFILFSKDSLFRAPCPGYATLGKRTGSHTQSTYQCEYSIAQFAAQKKRKAPLFAVFSSKFQRAKLCVQLRGFFAPVRRVTLWMVPSGS